ncbi:MAG: arginine--tRNA ligase [Elusimicrobia bacterium]|nr:arginine--tRNA ligase [Elusimicrobiota bacterium]MDE2236619.1 arginine--tRNA ligase [Elusimicrobiota bacterium]MDE2424305.1 arginine--tRNA ligase [Elusimicrobiota bacterium]
MLLPSLRQALSAAAEAWAGRCGLSLPDNLPLNPAPAHLKDADVSVPWAMALAKAARMPPLKIAQALAKEWAALQQIESAQAAAPGFVNLRLRARALCDNLKAVTLAPDSYGADPAGPKTRMLIEFVSANPTGPLHLASGRGATLGDALVRVLNRLGRRAQAEYYVNDAGARVELLGQSIKARSEGREPPEKGYHGAYLQDLASQAPAEAAGWDAKAWGHYAMEALLAQHKKDMDEFGVRFDRWYRESELFASDAVSKTLDFLKRRGMVYERDGAVWLGTAAAEGSRDDKDRVLVKSDGNPTYFLPDIAYHKDKFDRGFEKLIDIWGADHHGYVPRMQAAIAALGRSPDDFHAIVHQLIHLYRGKEAVKMSKRAGEFVRLAEVVSEVGRDACRFFFALRTPDSHLNFDLELAKKQSSENPVYYCQYVHARICSIFREAAKQGLLPEGSPLPEPDAALLTAGEERALLVKIAWFPEALKAVERELSPHPLANYVLELAGLFHPFYEKCRVLDAASPELSRARLLLCAGARDTVAQGLGLLGVSAPEQM